MRLLTLGLIGGIAWFASASPAMAQDAAETAVLTGTMGSATAKGSRSVGSSAGGGMGKVADSIRGRTPDRRAGSRSRRAQNRGVTVIGTGDPLEGSDAEAYAMEGGATVTFSGGHRPPAANRCAGDCTQELKAEGKSAQGQ